jgi:hypothetical protein
MLVLLNNLRAKHIFDAISLEICNERLSLLPIGTTFEFKQAPNGNGGLPLSFTRGEMDTVDIKTGG